MSYQKLFDYLHDELGVIALESQMQDIQRIVLESEAAELKRLESMQEYNLEHGFNDEKINDRIRELKPWNQNQK
ncbi:hypothetical protein [Flavobacterium sp. 25HG05S-40]|uniref:hypothetical protein n=1 Tax=Flavobacterium sp. 25HG05S-40 TaxID=3458682 RepID=UPI0040447A2B